MINIVLATMKVLNISIVFIFKIDNEITKTSNSSSISLFNNSNEIILSQNYELLDDNYISSPKKTTNNLNNLIEISKDNMQMQEKKSGEANLIPQFQKNNSIENLMILDEPLSVLPSGNSNHQAHSYQNHEKETSLDDIVIQDKQIASFFGPSKNKTVSISKPMTCVNTLFSQQFDKILSSFRYLKNPNIFNLNLD